MAALECESQWGAALPILAVRALAYGTSREGRPLRPRTRHAGSAERPADARARHGGRGRAFDARTGEDDRPAGQIFGDARQGAFGRARLWRAYARSAARTWF